MRKLASHPTRTVIPIWNLPFGALIYRVWRIRAVRWWVIFLPTLLSGLYYFGAAADQYETEARFVVRSAARPEMPGGLAFLAQLGIGRSQDDSFIVHDYLTSRDAIERLDAELPLKEMFGRAEADFLARYPSILFGPRQEQFYHYFQWMVHVVHVDKTGISTLSVRAFRAADAQAIAIALLAAGEELVNRINRRIQNDAIGSSMRELQSAQQRLIDAQTALTTFRNRELIVDPARSAVALAELIARLSTELGTTQAQITEMRSGPGASPQLLGLQRKAVALEEQIARERTRVAAGGDDLAGRIATYERLSIEREFANRMVKAAEEALIRARAEAARQLLYLERVIQPNLADYPTQPKRMRNVLTVLAMNVLAVLIVWLTWSGVREHAQ